MLKHLELINFRNWQKNSFDFAKTTIIVGPNSAGKTNLIEAINLLSTGRSWRTKRDIEAISWGKDFAKISGYAKNEKDLTLELIIQPRLTLDRPHTKSIKINGVRKKLTDILGLLPSVLFSPEEIHLIDGAPILRRRFVDILICQIDRKYALALLDLGKIIRGRNRLLFYLKIGKARTAEIDFWDEKLIILGSFIISRRKEIIENLNNNLSRIYGEIAGKKENLQIKYKSTVSPENFQKTLISNRQKEIEQTATLYGPHRDDLIFNLENKNIITFGSRGEFRSAILALKIAEQKYLNQEINFSPTLLLDDIFSELDKRRRLHLAKVIKQGQTIITTADPGQIEDEIKKEAEIIKIGH